MNISFNTRLNNTVTFDLSVGSGKLNLYGYRFRFGFSEFGFGHLSQTVTLEVADDDTLYDLIFDNERSDVELKIMHSQLGMLFKGYPETQRIRRIRFYDGKRGIRVTFIDAVKFLTSVDYRPVFGSALVEKIPSFNLVAQFINDTLFDKYDSVDYAHRIEAVGAADTRTLFNGLVFNRNLAQSSVNEFMAKLSRSFWFRYGYSFARQGGCVIQMDAGYDGSITFVTLDGTKTIDGRFNSNIFKDNIVKEEYNLFDATDETVQVKTLQNDKFTIDDNRVTEEPVFKLGRITYEGPRTEHTELNQNLQNPFDADDYTAPEIEVDETLNTIQRANFDPGPTIIVDNEEKTTTSQISAEIRQGEDVRSEFLLRGVFLNLNEDLLEGEVQLQVIGKRSGFDDEYLHPGTINNWQTQVNTIKLPFGSSDPNIEVILNVQTRTHQFDEIKIKFLPTDFDFGQEEIRWTTIDGNHYVRSGEQTDRIAMTAQIGGDLFLQNADEFTDERLGDNYGLPELNARLHMLAREKQQRNIRADYLEILDPMLPFIFDDQVYVMVDGEFDLQAEVTQINDSLSFAIIFVTAVLDAGGFVADTDYALKIINAFEGASLICTMDAGDQSKLFFQS